MSAKEVLNDIINDFDIQKFKRFFREKSRTFRPIEHELNQYNNEDFSDGTMLGEIDLAEDNDLIVFAFKVNKELTERSGKKAQYILGKKILKETARYAAGIFIFYDENSNFRFSLIYDIPKPGAKRDWSSFRRFTYFVSKELTNKTFLIQMEAADFSLLDNIIDAFSVEKVTKEFYQEIANWYFWAVKNVKFPDDAENETNGRNIAVIRLITRLIFIWFMKAKGLIGNHLFNPNNLEVYLKDLKPNSKDSAFYNAILQNLFFATLNTKIEDRKFRREHTFQGKNKDYMAHNYYRHHSLFKNPEEMLNIFKGIPFLNGGLFECLDKSKDDPTNETGKEIRIDGFSDKEANQPIVPNFLFFSDEQKVDLQKDYGADKYKNAKVKGIINILQSYNFTIDENTPTDEEVALDPELLGKVFENLLASYNPETATTARKSTGSYYTPREIVDYMVTESLREYFKTQCGENIENIEQKLEMLFSYADESNPFTEEETELIIEKINSLTVIDPAVGSGAFPMGALHKLVFILSKLDPHNKQWKQQQINAIEKNISDPKLKRELIAKIEDSFNKNELDYGRKLFLIQNCLYGVDIQPIAIQIAKLRFFISLLVDEKIQSSDDNYGIEPLPNLETKLVAANTLIGLSYDTTFKPKELDELEEELFVLRKKYFTASEEKEKRKIEKKDRELRLQIKSVLQENRFPAEYSEKISSWDPYNTNVTSGWFDPEWMFGVKNGFDMVIGNPPYISIRTKSFNSSFKNIYKELFHLAVGQFDLFILFIEKSVNILKDQGVLSFIIPTRFLSNETFQKARYFVYRNCRIVNYLDAKMPFESASVEANAFIGVKNSNSENISTYSYDLRKKVINKLSKMNYKFINKLPFNIFPFIVNQKEIDIINKILNSQTHYLLGKYLNITRGFEFGYNHNSITATQNDFPLIKPESICKYFLNNKTELYVNVDFQNKTIFKTKETFIKTPKLLTKFISNEIIFAIDNKGFVNTNVVYNCHLRANNENINYYKLLGWLNSKLISFWFKITFLNLDTLFPHIQKNQLTSIIIPTQNFDWEHIENLVTKIISKKETGEDTTAEEGEIDLMVYKLYELTYEEVKIIDPTFALTEKKYEEFKL